MNTLGANISARREACGIDQLTLSERVNVSPPMISMIESGRRIPSVALLADIAAALDTSVDYLLGREENKGEIRQ